MFKKGNTYKCLKVNEFHNNSFSIVPIRFKDRFDIMNWRNDQLYHLRQTVLLNNETQNKYFNDVVFKLFSTSEPDQILFSFLSDNVCVGYGGLVHIDWTNRNAEISFLINTNLESSYFNTFWSNFLYLIEEVAFKELNLHKMYVYSFNLRPHLYTALENSNYLNEAILKDHKLISNNFVDVLIHSKINLK